MGLGSSKQRAEKKRRNQSLGKQKPRRGIFRKIRPYSTVPPTVPYPRPHPPASHYQYGSRCPGQQIAGYGRSPLSYPYSLLKPYNTYSPRLYNNYSSFPLQNYGSQPYIAPSQPLIIPPPISQLPPVIIPQVSEPPVMVIPNQVPPSFTSPSLAPYLPAAAYASPQTPYQAIYNPVGRSPFTATGIGNPVQVGPSYYPGGNANLFTDWTGGGQISPGFLGPPL